MSKTVICAPAAAGRKVAHLPVEHRHTYRGILDEGAKLPFTGSQFFLGMLALGDVGGKSEYVLRNSGRVAQERELHAGPDNSGITSKVALLAVETFDFT